VSRSGSFAYRKAKTVPDNLYAFPPSMAVAKIVPGKKRFTTEAQRTQRKAFYC
jgi:hypothetical protein